MASNFCVLCGNAREDNVIAYKEINKRILPLSLLNMDETIV